MSFLRKIFDRLVEHDFRWASTLFKLAFWWITAFFGLIILFYLFYRMKDLLSTIPPVIQAACVILVVMAVTLMIAMFRERNRALQAYDRFLAAFEDLKPATERERFAGLSQDKMIALRRKAALLPGKPREWWQALDESMELYASLTGEEGVFLTRPVPECLPEEAVVDSFYHSRFHESVPGILTALGLLATFVAILMALAGVTYNVRDPMRPVSGIDQLINGLSGKFLSSIIALVLSVIFTLFEKKLCDRPLRNGYDALIRRCKDVFPFLTQSRILLDIQRIALSHTREAAGYPMGPERG
jgi:hypothetical protein